jgi:acetyl esterase/lipase
MHANKKCVNVVGDVGDVDVDLYPFLLRYKDGHVERLLCSPFVAASGNPTSNRGVATRDVVIHAGTGVSARLFLPCRAAASRGRKLPLVVYIHGGSFCTESAFCRTYHRYATSLAASAGAIVVSVEYRLAPEHPIPTAYDDAWAALRWAASLADPWLAEHADPRRTFLAGDSAGGNIAYHTAVRASRRDDGVDVEGVVIVQPYFWGAERLPSESGPDDGAAVLPVYRVDRLWPFVTAGQAGNEDARLNPPDEEIASLTCRRVLVAVAGKDTLRDRGVRLFARIRDYYARAAAGRAATATLVESDGEDHGFHLYSPLRATSRKLMESIVHFINQPPPPTPELEYGLQLHAGDAWGWEGFHADAATHRPIVLGVPSRPFRDIFDYGMDMKRFAGTTCRAYEGPSKIGHGNLATPNKVKYGRFVTGPWRPTKAYKGPARAALPGTRVVKNFF